MSWSTIRRATAEDRERLARFERNFEDRHKVEMERNRLDMTDLGVACSRSSDIDREYAWKRLSPLYWAGVRRALRDPAAEGIAYGYVGRSVS